MRLLCYQVSILEVSHKMNAIITLKKIGYSIQKYSGGILFANAIYNLTFFYLCFRYVQGEFNKAAPFPATKPSQRQKNLS